MGSVLDDRQVMAGGDVINGIQVAGLAAIVDRDDGAGAGQDGRFDCFGQDVQVVADIHQHRAGAQVDDDVGGGAKGHGGEDDVATGADPQGGEGDVQPGGAGIDGDGVAGVQVSGDVGLETLDLGAGGDPAGAEGIGDFGDLVFVDGGLGEG